MQTKYACNSRIDVDTACCECGTGACVTAVGGEIYEAPVPVSRAFFPAGRRVYSCALSISTALLSALICTSSCVMTRTSSFDGSPTVFWLFLVACATLAPVGKYGVNIGFCISTPCNLLINSAFVSLVFTCSFYNTSFNSVTVKWFRSIPFLSSVTTDRSG